MSRKISAEVFGFGGAATSGVKTFFGLAAALFLEKLLSDFLSDFFGEFLDEFFGGFVARRVALFDGRFGSFLELFAGPLPLLAPGFLDEVLEAVARLAVPVDVDFARGSSFQFDQIN
ncbi:MAG: hypothetical protein Q7T73_03890 [Beijerinckiaceae bacterium]|nr:hypothetical protein [Beijerinckiaceae bacterium]